MQNLNTPIKSANGSFHIQNLNVEALAKQYGSPLYVYDLDHIVGCYKDLLAAFTWGKTKLHYAMKANYNLDILKALLAAGSGIDAVSPSEVLLCLKLGFDKKDILYTANNVTDEEMRIVHEQGVLLNIDALSALKRYGEAFQGSDVCLRFNSEVVAGENAYVQTGGDKTKFGIRLDDVELVLQIVKKYNLRVVGLHEHTGSGIAESEKFYHGMRNLLKIAKPEYFPDLRFIDFGGGIKVPYKPGEKRIDLKNFATEVTEIFSAFCSEYGRQLELYFEPGKYIVAEGGILLLQVNTIKNSKGRIIAGTNSGFNHLVRPMLYDAYHYIINLTNPEGEVKVCDVCGNICETGDLFASDRELPEIREGDYLAILNAGAYGFSMSSTYNMRPLPAEVVIANGEAKLSLRRKSHQELAEEILQGYI